MTKPLVVAVLTLVALICSFPSSSWADQITVTVDEQQYDITTLTSTFTANMAELESEPWWGNATLAQAIANAVADDIGTPNVDGTSGPLFAYDLDALDAFIWFHGSSSSTSIPTSGLDILSFSWGACADVKGGCANVCSTTGANAGRTGIPPCGTGGNVPEPGSLGILLVGLLAYFWALHGKRPRRNGPATEA